VTRSDDAEATLPTEPNPPWTGVTVLEVGAMRLSRTPVRRAHAGPPLGDSTAKVLAEIGYPDNADETVMEQR
jgi:crotonobetainyl-CoA:carnitine CoA-transferase CaiB-like acyl-CoA transferase